jgi:YesN/AraC family two-component response regulator
MKTLDKKFILIVDDEELIREILIEELTFYGANVISAENGTVAFELIQKNKFDAVITDVRMPNGNGLVLIKNINSKIQDKPKIFICSGYNDISETEIQSLNVSYTFNKPFEREDFIAIISKNLAAS